jgi:hypothetical protein
VLCCAVLCCALCMSAGMALNRNRKEKSENQKKL